MFIQKSSAALCLAFAMFAPAMASAEVRIYPYHSEENYCPAGLQPVTIDGVICCGNPNQHVSYQDAMSHPVRVERHAVYAKPVNMADLDCAIGTKGCDIR